MKVTTQNLKFSKYDLSVFLENKEEEFEESNIICLLIKQKNTITKNKIVIDNVEIKQTDDKYVIFFKEFQLLLKNGNFIIFTIYDNNELNNIMKKMKIFTNLNKPIIFDNFLEESPLFFNSENYCYVKKELIKTSKIRKGQKDLGDNFYNEQDNDLLILPQTDNLFHFNILELNFGLKKIKLNMFLKKTLEYNEMHVPNLITYKQKIKRML